MDPKEILKLVEAIHNITLDVNVLNSAFSTLVNSYVKTTKTVHVISKKSKLYEEENDELLSAMNECKQEISKMENGVCTVKKIFGESEQKIVGSNQNERKIDFCREILKDCEILFEINKLKSNPTAVKQATRNTFTTNSSIEITGSDENGGSDFGNFNQVEIKCAKRHYFIEESTTPFNIKRFRSSIKLKEIEHSFSQHATEGPWHSELVLAEKFSNTAHLNDSNLQQKISNIPNDRFCQFKRTINRPHSFIQKSMINGGTCSVCSKRIKFSGCGLKCNECKCFCHNNCQEKVTLPCIPLNTQCKNKPGLIADFSPKRTPMVPALIVHCISEIEARGLTHIGLYRTSGSDKEIKNLKAKLLKKKGVLNMSKIGDVHTICGCLKEFLRSLKEPIITHMKWNDFVTSVGIDNQEERQEKLLQTITRLPKPNKDTLAYLILHLQRVSEVDDCQMPVCHLAKMFGPTIIGYSKQPKNILAETSLSNKVMTELLSIPTKHWEFLLLGLKNSEEKDRM